jgi:hypothetical protein
MDFTTNYLVVGSVAEAMILSASGFVLGPFVYFGHDKAWDDARGLLVYCADYHCSHSIAISCMGANAGFLRMS